MSDLSNQFYYSEKEDRLNVISHGTGFVLSIIGLVFLINKGLQDFDITRFSSFIIYGISLSTMYIASTLYHNSKTPKNRYNFRLFDMISIYLLIAGSYTPFTLTVLIDDGGLILFALVWFIAFFGIIWKIFTVGKYNFFSTMLYMFMGGLWIFFIDSFINEIPPSALLWIFASCSAYLIGVFFYLADSSIKYNHFIWHIFVLLGSAFHFISIYFYI
tara:strand:- start:1221 stop:1868 length:648 start_codon:yes stop_codon:yes gene_type:complete